MPSTTRPRDAYQPNQPQNRTGRGRPGDDQEDYSPGSLDRSPVNDQLQQRSRTRKARERI